MGPIMVSAGWILDVRRRRAQAFRLHLLVAHVHRRVGAFPTGRGARSACSA
jgi:hypothetical protein